jgi:hypothetical protein
MDGPPLASLSLTHVHYDPTNKISHACAYLALVPQALCITYATLIWSSREMEILLMFAGQMACEALNWVLKRFIREDRPTQMMGKGYGMPSSHAQFVAFFAVYLGLWVVVRHDPWKTNESKTHVPTPMWQRVALALAALGGAVAVAQSRMYVPNSILSHNLLLPLTIMQISQLPHTAPGLHWICSWYAMWCCMVCGNFNWQTLWSDRLLARLRPCQMAQDARPSCERGPG